MLNPVSEPANKNLAKILLATGGTGGHIFPAVALGQVLRQRGHSIAMIGADAGMEKDIAAREGIYFFGVRAGKLDRQNPDPRALLQAGLGFGDAFGVVGKFKPDCVVGFGGFASFPGCAASALRGVPLVLHEANAIGGLVTRLSAPFAKCIGTAFKEVERLPRHKLRHVGMPVREEKFDVAFARTQLGLDPNLPLIFIMGGSQGSVALNRLLPKILERSLSNKNVQVLHQTGKGRLPEVDVAHLPWYHCVEFVNGPLAFSAASFAITRGGSSTIGDAAFHGVPLLLVPLPTSADDQQNKNALAVAASGAGLVVSQSDLEIEAASSGSGLSNLADGMLRCLEPKALLNMRAAALQNSPAGAADRLANLVEEVCNKIKKEI